MGNVWAATKPGNRKKDKQGVKTAEFNAILFSV